MSKPVSVGIAEDPPAGGRGRTRLTLPQVLGHVQTAPLPIPLQNPVSLPLYDLDPYVLERLAAEVVSHRNNRGAHFYGRSGQKQYGLDIVEFEWDGSTSLYQVKRYKTLSSKQMKRIVEEYAGPARKSDHVGPARRFDPRRFVIVTSALVEDDTGNIDGLQDLQQEYHGDLALEVWGREALGRKLRGAPHAVLAIFGPAWAAAWCGFAPQQPPPGYPSGLGLVGDPVEALNLGSLHADARSREASAPADAAALYGTLARNLREGGFPGHAALMLQKQAALGEIAGNRDLAFELLFELGMNAVLAGEDLIHGPLRGKLDGASAPLSGLQLDKSVVLRAAADWYEQGSVLTRTVPALRRLYTAGDPHCAVLTCLIIEQAVVDSLYDYEPPYSVVAQTDGGTDALLQDLAELADSLDVPDPLIRARLHCAVADAKLGPAADEASVQLSFGQVADDALAGRYLHARGTVTSRAAYAFAVRGHTDRAVTLWRQSILASSEERLYGDARNASDSSRLLDLERGVLSPGLDTLPNDHRALSGSYDPALAALAAAHRGKLPDAFGDARRYIWESRLAGHLAEEMRAMSLFGDVLREGDQKSAAVACYILAGDSEKAGETARELPALADVSTWISSSLRRRKSAAIQVTGAQAPLVDDGEVLAVIGMLTQAADGLWTSTIIQPHPELDAVRAIASFGVRIPDDAVDPLLELAAPALTRATGVSPEIARLVVETYHASEARRSDLAVALAEMLGLPDGPQELWQLTEAMPADTRQALMPTITDMASKKDPRALEVLAAWRHPSHAVQLSARRACAALLRQPVGIPKEVFHVGSQEVTTVRQLLALLDAEDLCAVAPSELTAEKSPPAGAILFSHSVGTQLTAVFTATETEDPGAQQANPALASREQPPADTVDAAAVTSAGPVQELASAVGVHLAAIAGDTEAGAASRTGALSALRVLLPSLPRITSAELVPSLLEIRRNPALSAGDQWEIDSDTGLSRFRMRTGARQLGPLALATAAEAFAAGRDATDELEDHELAIVNEVVALAAESLRDTERRSQIPQLGALAVVAVARSAPGLSAYSTGLVFHGNETVRAAGARHMPGIPQFFSVASKDPSSRVRIALAHRAAKLPDATRAALSADPHIGVRWALKKSLPVLTGDEAS